MANDKIEQKIEERLLNMVDQDLDEETVQREERKLKIQMTKEEMQKIAEEFETSDTRFRSGWLSCRLACCSSASCSVTRSS